jgi:hypothetical protein
MPMFHAHNQGASCVTRTPPLDAVSGATAAYSLSKLRTAYTGAAIRVRNFNNTQVDVGFTACGDLDTATLRTLSRNSLPITVVKLYDQSGNGKDLGDILGQGPEIIDSFGVIRRVGSKPAIYFRTTDKIYNSLTGTTLSMSSYFSCFYVIKNIDDNATYRGLFSIFNNTGNGPSYEFYTQAQGASGDWVANDAMMFGGNGVNGSPRIISNGKIYSGQYSTTSLFMGAANSGMYINGSEITYRVKVQTATFTMSDYLSLGGVTGAPVYQWQGHWQELIIYTTDKSSDKTTMESNINSYYSIY